MDAMLPPDRAAAAGGEDPAASPEIVRELGRLLEDHRGGSVRALDLRSLNAWTDFFLIATVSSDTHLRGLERHIKDFAGERGLEIRRRSSGPRTEAEAWGLIDCGSLVIHLMTAGARDFYELERLWGAATVIYRGGETPEPSYSSNSS